jgi:hypothetical protein
MGEARESPRSIADVVAALGDLSGRPVVVLAAGLHEDVVVHLYRVLREVPEGAELDLVLNTEGGSVAVARRLVSLIRDRSTHVRVLIPQTAASAGTLVAMSADEIVMSPLSELSPIDPVMLGSAPAGPGTPASVSAQDIRSFTRMAHEWFGVDRAEGLHLLSILSQKMFPPSLAELYRFEASARETAHELLRFQLRGDEHEAKRVEIVDALMDPLHLHESAITRADARVLGLRVRDADPCEEQLLSQFVAIRQGHSLEAGRRRLGVVMNRSTAWWKFMTEGPPRGGGAGPAVDISWEPEPEYRSVHDHRATRSGSDSTEESNVA